MEWNEQQAVLIAEAITRHFRTRKNKFKGFGK
jgi:hypothetical protein